MPSPQTVSVLLTDILGFATEYQYCGAYQITSYQDQRYSQLTPPSMGLKVNPTVRDLASNSFDPLLTVSVSNSSTQEQNLYFKVETQGLNAKNAVNRFQARVELCD